MNKYSRFLNRPEPELLDENDFLIFPEAKKTKRMCDMEDLIGNEVDLPNYLYRQYYVNNNSSWSIEFELGVSSDLVRTWMGKYGMVLRSKEEFKNFLKITFLL